jgi:hypothetical protein
VLVSNWLGIPEIDFADNIDYSKAERDLELAKNGEKPQNNPFSNWTIVFLVFSEYTKTEEYEESTPQVQTGILGLTQWYQEMMRPPPMPGGPPPATGLPPKHMMPGGIKHPPGITSQAAKAKGSFGGAPAPHILSQIPGAAVPPGQVQAAGALEAQSVVPQASGAN